MIVEYDGEEYEFDLEDIDVEQATVIKRFNESLTLNGLERGLADGDPDAIRAMYWLMRRQSGHRDAIETVNFKIVKFANALQAAADKEEAERVAKEKSEKKGTRSKNPTV